MDPFEKALWIFILVVFVTSWVFAIGLWLVFKDTLMNYWESRTDKAIQAFANAIAGIPDVHVLSVGTLFDSATDSPQLTFSAPLEFVRQVQLLIRDDPNLVEYWCFKTWVNECPQPPFQLSCPMLSHLLRDTALGFRWIPTPKRAKSDLKELEKIFWKATSLVDCQKKVSDD